MSTSSESPGNPNHNDRVSEDLVRQIKVLSEVVWENSCKQPDLDDWLDNFTGQSSDVETERLHALHLLSNLSYFGLRELRMLMRAMFRDLYRYPRIQEIRRDLRGTKDARAVGDVFGQRLESTRFMGMGNPAESGAHLLYYFRQVNALPKRLFADSHQLLTRRATDPAANLRHPEVDTLVFIDDVCGSGVQAIDYSEFVVADLKEVAERNGKSLTVEYLVLFGLSEGLETVRSSGLFDNVAAVHLMEDPHRAFSAESRIYKKAPVGVSAITGEAMALTYGNYLSPTDPLGYENGQLLLALHHNVPDNSLPIVWYDDPEIDWTPIFKRFQKVYE